jgi:hypothetical protein
MSKPIYLIFIVEAASLLCGKQQFFLPTCCGTVCMKYNMHPCTLLANLHAEYWDRATVRNTNTIYVEDKTDVRNTQSVFID